MPAPAKIDPNAKVKITVVHPRQCELDTPCSIFEAYYGTLEPVTYPLWMLPLVPDEGTGEVRIATINVALAKTIVISMPQPPVLTET